MLGEIGEAAVRLRFLTIGFQFDGRSRLEAGVDGIAEVMQNGQPLARMIAVQVKATGCSRYLSEDDRAFTTTQARQAGNHDQEPWKLPLPEFIGELYYKRFNKRRPDVVRSIEETAAVKLAKKQAKKAAAIRRQGAPDGWPA